MASRMMKHLRQISTVRIQSRSGRVFRGRFLVAWQVGLLMVAWYCYGRNSGLTLLAGGLLLVMGVCLALAIVNHVPRPPARRRNRTILKERKVPSGRYFLIGPFYEAYLVGGLFVIMRQLNERFPRFSRWLGVSTLTAGTGIFLIAFVQYRW
jgi:hypothetical protein